MDLEFNKINETYLQIKCNDGIAHELHDYFTFTVDNFRFMPAFKRGWNGKKYLFNLRTRMIYSGLYKDIIQFCKDYDYSFSSFDEDKKYIDRDKLIQWIKTLKLPFEPRDYQLESLINCITNKRNIVISPTGSGKTFIIYLLCRFLNLKTLLIVPSVGLCSQMMSDFKSYGYEDDITEIYEGKSKNVNTPITISLWQSIYKLSEEWFNQFDVIIVDEAHLAKASSLTSIMEKATQCKYRFGFTGTLDESKTNQMVLKGLFGSIYRTTSTFELINNNILSDFHIECLKLKYNTKDIENISNSTYQEEIDFILSHEKRNEFIIKLVSKLRGNTLVLFQYVDKHGKVLYDKIKSENPNRNIYYISGEIKGEIREKIRKEIEEKSDVILIASVQTVGTGINITSLKNIIFTSPTKSKIRTLQSIGRVLRKTEHKNKAFLWDIIDDLSKKSKVNHTLKHAIERMKIYTKEKFEFNIRNITLGD